MNTVLDQASRHSAGDRPSSADEEPGGGFSWSRRREAFLGVV